MITDEQVKAAKEAFNAYPEITIEELPKAWRAALEAAEAAAWRPIEEAPKDGTWFIIKCDWVGDEYQYEIGRHKPLFCDSYEEAGNGFYKKTSSIAYEWDGFNNFHAATQFRPLPEPPK